MCLFRIGSLDTLSPQQVFKLPPCTYVCTQVWSSSLQLFCSNLKYFYRWISGIWTVKESLLSICWCPKSLQAYMHHNILWLTEISSILIWLRCSILLSALNLVWGPFHFSYCLGHMFVSIIVGDIAIVMSFFISKSCQ